MVPWLKPLVCNDSTVGITLWYQTCYASKKCLYTHCLATVAAVSSAVVLPSEVKVYQQIKFLPDISIGGWDITTSFFEIQTSAILEFYFWFRPRPFRRNRRVILHPAVEFRSNKFGTSAAEIWRHIDFHDGGRQPCCICFGVMADHPRSAFRGLNCDFKSLVRRRYCDVKILTFWLETAYSRPFLGSFWGSRIPIWRTFVFRNRK